MVLATTRKRFRALKHLFLRYCKCSMNESFLSKVKPRNFVCSTTGIGVPLSSNCGSGCALRRRQKCTQTVLVDENLKPLESTQCCNLLRDH